MWLFSWLFKSKPKLELKRWPTTDVTYCFRDMPYGSRNLVPQEYRGLIIECAQEWTDKTVINLVLKNYNTVPQPDIVISMKHLKRGWLGFGYFPGKTALSGDIDLDHRDWLKDYSVEYFKMIILHEFGHALGLVHSRSRRSLMYKAPMAKGIDGFTVDKLNDMYEEIV